jgi:hypothetical protein
MAQADPIGVKGILELLMVILADTHNKQSEIINKHEEWLKELIRVNNINAEGITTRTTEIANLKREIDGVVQSANDDATQLLNELKAFAQRIGFLQANPNFFNPTRSG